MLEDVKLVSDFRDQHYDFMFKPNGTKTYRRMSAEGPDKINQFLILSSMGFKIPPIGSVEYLYHMWDKDTEEPWVVVYTDQSKHTGDGKTLLPVSKAVDLYPGFFASIYIRNSNPTPTSYRALYVGSKYLFMRYRSNDAWRSNCGDVYIEEASDVLKDTTEKIILNEMGVPLTSVPIVAIDFVLDVTERLIAIDLNIAPGISGTPATIHFSPVDIYEAIQRFLFNYKPWEWSR